MNKLLKLEIDGHNSENDHYVEIYHNKIKKIGSIDEFIISKSVVDGVTVCVAEITDYYLILTLYPVKFVEKISKKYLKDKAKDANDLHKYKHVFGE